MTKEQQDDINSLKELIADKSISADERQVYIDGLAELEKNIGEKPQATEKPQTTQRAKQTTKPKKAITKKAKAVKKATPLPSDVDAMKKAIKERTGKTEAECEDIIAQYRKLREKAKVNNAKRTEKLKSNDDLITGTNVITPVAQIEKDAEIVKVKIEKQVEQIENKAEREVVKKDKTKDEVKVEVEQKVVKQLAKLSDEMVSSATTFVKNIQTELKKVDKTEAKNFLLGLRNEIDALLSKFGDGGSTIETYNITENESASSVNPSLFARGGGVTKTKTGAIKLYYHQTSGGAEYLSSSKVKGTKDEGSMDSEYIVRIDGAKDFGGELFTKAQTQFARGGVTKNDYVVNVGNIGNIPCDSLLEARMMYNEYVEQSKSGMGRAGNEYVGLYKNGEPMLEYFGTLDNDNEYKRGGVSGKDNRAKQVIRTINGKKRKFPIGDAWRKEHKEENESQKYEVPYGSRKG